MTDTQALIERLTKLAAKATPSPWGVCVDATGDTFIASMTDSAETVCEFGAMDDDEGQSAIAYDSALIVALVNNLPTLTEALTEAEAKLTKAREALRQIMELPGEINPSNYTHDDACELNHSFCEGYELARACLAELGEG